MSVSNTHLFDEYQLGPLTKEFGAFYAKTEREVFGRSIDILADEWQSEKEKEQQKDLYKLIEKRYSFSCEILHDKELIGWHYGWQIDAETYYMCNTAIVTDHRRKGIYTALLQKLIVMYAEKGFQKIYSRHLASNSAVIIPKLKAGFVITGFEIDDQFGLMVALTYYTNAKRLNAYKFRTGALRPDEDIKKFL